MLGKLIKHEFKAVNRLMIPLHLALILVSIIGRFYIQYGVLSDAGQTFMSQNLWFTIINGSLAGMYVVALIAISIVTHLYLQILRPRKTLFTDEGYLTHTLPVSAADHIWSKLIVAFVWSVLDTVLILLSLLAMFVNKLVLADFSSLFRTLIESFSEAFGMSFAMGMTLFVLITIFDTIAGILIIYACMAVGHSFNNHKILASIGIYAGYNVVVSLISSIFTTILGTRSVSTPNAILAYATMAGTSSYFWGVMIYSLILSIALAVGAFAATNYFLKRRLNLE